MTRNSGSRSRHTTYDARTRYDSRACAMRVDENEERTEAHAASSAAAFARVLHFPRSLAAARFRGVRDERGASGHSSESSDIQ
jgi:hypothetical protein